VNRDVLGICGPVASLAGGSITQGTMFQVAKMDYWQERRDETSRSMPSSWIGKESESASSIPGYFGISIAKFALPVTRILAWLPTNTLWQLWIWAVSSDIVYRMDLRISQIYT